MSVFPDEIYAAPKNWAEKDVYKRQSDYRVVQLAYLQLVGSYLTAASQLNFAVGREVIP